VVNQGRCSLMTENWETGVQSLVWAKSLTPGFALINHFYLTIMSQSGLIVMQKLRLELSLTLIYQIENQVTIRHNFQSKRTVVNSTLLALT